MAEGYWSFWVSTWWITVETDKSINNWQVPEKYWGHELSVLSIGYSSEHIGLSYLNTISLLPTFQTVHYNLDKIFQSHIQTNVWILDKSDSPEVPLGVCCPSLGSGHLSPWWCRVHMTPHACILHSSYFSGCWALVQSKKAKHSWRTDQYFTLKQHLCSENQWTCKVTCKQATLQNHTDMPPRQLSENSEHQPHHHNITKKQKQKQMDATQRGNTTQGEKPCIKGYQNVKTNLLKGTR